MNVRRTDSLPIAGSSVRKGMTNYRIGPHTTTSDRIGLHETIAVDATDDIAVLLKIRNSRRAKNIIRLELGLG